MTVKFYMDEHFPGPVTSGLRAVGVDVLTAQEDGRDGLPDDLLLARAAELNRVLVTQDRDFEIVSRTLQSRGEGFAGILFAQQGKLSHRQWIDELEMIAKCSVVEEWQSSFTRIPL